MVNLSTTGSVIKTARKKKKLTQEQVAEHLGITAVAVSRYESGNRTPDYITCCRLAALLDIPLESLIPDEIWTWFDAGAEYGKDRAEGTFLDDDECLLLEHFYYLNDAGRKEAIKRMSELRRLKEYKAEEGRTQKDGE